MVFIELVIVKCGKELDNVIVPAILEFNTLNGEQDTQQNLTALCGGRPISSRGRKARNKEEEVCFRMFAAFIIHTASLCLIFLHEFSCNQKKEIVHGALNSINMQLLEMFLR